MCPLVGVHENTYVYVYEDVYTPVWMVGLMVKPHTGSREKLESAEVEVSKLKEALLRKEGSDQELQGTEVGVYRAFAAI